MSGEGNINRKWKRERGSFLVKKHLCIFLKESNREGRENSSNWISYSIQSSYCNFLYYHYSEISYSILLCWSICVSTV